MNSKVRVTPQEDGAIISVNGFDITITVKPAVAPRITVELVQSRLAEHLEELDVRVGTEGIVVKPKGFLGRDRFALIATIIETLSGYYISAGKESRFIVPKE